MIKLSSIYAKKRLFDDALLFVISSFSIVVAIFVAIVGINQVIYLFPLLLIWVIFPFYTGYLRGAIETDSIVERGRGWIYLIIGVSSYAAFLTFRIDPPTDIILYALFLLVGYLSALRLIRWVIHVFNKTVFSGEQIALVCTGIAAGFLSYASIIFATILQTFVTAVPIVPASLWLTVFILLSGLIGFLVYEKVSRVIIHYHGRPEVKSKILFVAIFSPLFALLSDKNTKKLFYFLLVPILTISLVGSLIGGRHVEVIPIFFLPVIFLLGCFMFYFTRYPLSRENIRALLRDLMSE